MRILIFLSVSCLIAYGNAAGNSNQIELASADDTVLGEAIVRQKRDLDGGKTEQDPNDPKYQKMAKELVRNNLRIKEEDTKNIKVNKVTTQVVSGIITRLEIKVTLVSGRADTCDFSVWDRSWEDVKHVTYKCLLQKQVLSGLRRPEQTRDPKDPKYRKLAEASIDYLFQTAGNKPFKKDDISKITVTNVKVKIGSKIMSYIQFNVNTVNNNNYQCTSSVLEKPWNPQETEKVAEVNCELAKGNTKLSASLSELNIPGGQVVENPYEFKYQSLAKISFQRYLDSHRDVNVHVKSIVIDSVTSQVVAGTNIRMHFLVYPTRGSRFQCRAIIFETLSGHYSDFNVSCHTIVGGEEEQDPDDPQYQQLAKESYQFYLKTHQEKFQVKRIKVDSVTTQVVAGMITRIHFSVYPTRGSRLDCQSKIFEHLGLGHNLEFDVNCSGIVGGEEEQDPHDPQYQQLAKESFQFYLNTHKENVQVKGIKVDSVTTQVVAGKITRIHFSVYPTRGSRLDCQSKIFEHLGLGHNLEFDVNCSGIVGGEEEQDPHDPQYQQLAKESFQFYLNTHKENVQVKGIKVDSVTTQVVAGKITRIHFSVYPTRGSRLDCQSKIFEHLGLGHNLEFDVNCSGIVGGEEEQDPHDPQYQQLAIESFKFYLKTHKENVQVKGIKVDSVTTQVVAGKITRIHFSVYPTRGSRLDCQSKIFKNLGPGSHLVFDVKCSDIVGGEEEQDPHDPQYQQLAKESFRKYRETHIGPLFNIKEQGVTRATTQLVAGLVTRLDFYVTTTEGGKYTCHSEIYERSWEKFKKIDVICVGPGGDAKRRSGARSLKLNSNSKRDNFASKAVKRYLEKEYDISYLKVTRTMIRSIRILKTRVSKQKITYYKVDAFARVPYGDHSMFNCSVLAGSWFGKKPIATNCIKVTYLMGGSEWSDPMNKKHLSFAEKSLQLYLKNSPKVVGPRDYRKYDVIVTFVQRGLAAGYVNDMKFVARWVHGNDDDPAVLICQTKVWEKLNGKPDIPEAKCTKVSWDRQQ